MTVNKYGDAFIPEIYGYSEPLKIKYNPNEISGPVSIYMHEEVNKKLAMHDQAGGSLMMKKKMGMYFITLNGASLFPNPGLIILDFLFQLV